MSALLRSACFMLLVGLLTVPYALLVVLCAWLPGHARLRLVQPWVAGALWLAEHLLGIRYRVLGREHLPARSAVFLCKHQSAWETLAMQRIVHDAIFVWKQELKYLPFFGWALAAIPGISIDRGAGKDALKQLAARGGARLREGYNVIIFPEGTRVAPGNKKRYKIGGAWLAVECGAPVVPVALNSGEVWGRNAFLKQAGTVTVSIGPAIDTAGASAEDVNARAERWIEAEMQRISPHLYGGTHAQIAAEHEAPQSSI